MPLSVPRNRLVSGTSKVWPGSLMGVFVIPGASNLMFGAPWGEVTQLAFFGCCVAAGGTLLTPVMTTSSLLLLESSVTDTDIAPVVTDALSDLAAEEAWLTVDTAVAAEGPTILVTVAAVLAKETILAVLAATLTAVVVAVDTKSGMLPVMVTTLLLVTT